MDKNQIAAKSPGTEPPGVYRRMIESVGGVASFTRGVSMLPLLRQGKSYVTVSRCDDDPQPADLLLFEQIRGSEKISILHRLIEIRPDGTYVCRGDNNSFCEQIRREDIIGRTVRISWTKDASRLMPWLLRAKRDTRNGGYFINVTDPGYLRYVRFWNAIWPLRRILYIIRSRLSPRRLYWNLRIRLGRIPTLHKIYCRLRKK